MQQVLDRYNSGVHVTNVTMQAVQPPEQVQEASDDAMKAGQDKERQKNEGQAYANDVIPKARGEASRMLQDAEGYRSKVVATAEGNAARFKQVLAEYQKAPAVTRDRMYLETMQQIFTSTTKLMIDSKSAGNMMYLPLDKIMGNDANQNRTPAPSMNVAPVEVPTVEVRAAKDLRARESRERGALMNRLISFLFSVAIALLVLYSTVFVVDQKSHAIVFAFGEVKSVISEPACISSCQRLFKT